MQVVVGLASGNARPQRVQSEQTYIPNPAADTGFTYTLSTNYNEWPIALAFELTTDSNAGNRQVGLKLETPSGIVQAAAPVASVQAASLTYTYVFASWLTSPVAVEASVVLCPFFPFVVPADYSFVVTIGGSHAGDQISNIAYYRDRYSTGPDGYPQGGFNAENLEAFYVETLNQG